jgi:hypothetical protein
MFLLMLVLNAERSTAAWTVRGTIWLSLAAYIAALWLMLRLDTPGWSAESRAGRTARSLWTLGCLFAAAHFAAAFHFVHEWSHSRAVEQTRIESGFGAGVFFNYLYLAVWLADVLWWHLLPAHYATRRRLIDGILHGYLAFIALNASVVFETGAIRWIAAAACTALAAHGWQSRRPFQRRL